MSTAKRILFDPQVDPPITVTVIGPAASQGSKTPIYNKLHQVVGMREDNKNVKPWRKRVAKAMVAARPNGFQPWDRAVKVWLKIYVRRPLAHFGTGRNANTLKATAPVYPLSGLDVDKVQRAVGDSGTGILWKDDARISAWDSERLYCGPGEPERVVIVAVARESVGEL